MIAVIVSAIWAFCFIYRFTMDFLTAKMKHDENMKSLEYSNKAVTKARYGESLL